MTLTHCISQSGPYPAVSSPPQYEEIDIGEEQPVRALSNGVWFLKRGGRPFVVLLAPVSQFGPMGQSTSVQFEIAAINSPEGTQLAQSFFKQLEEAVLRAESYRGKILSLEQSENNYTGQATGIKVYKLRTVERDQVILPEKTLELLDRNVIHFVQQRQKLA